MNKRQRKKQKRSSLQQEITAPVAESPRMPQTEDSLLAGINKFFMERKTSLDGFLPSNGKFESFPDALYAIARGNTPLYWTFSFPRKGGDDSLSKAVKGKIKKARNRYLDKSEEERYENDFVNFVAISLTAALAAHKKPQIEQLNIKNVTINEFDGKNAWSNGLKAARELTAIFRAHKGYILGIDCDRLSQAEAKPLHAGLVFHVQEKVAFGDEKPDKPASVASVEDALRGIFILEAPRIAFGAIGKSFRESTERFAKLFPGELGGMIRKAGVDFESLTTSSDGSLDIDKFLDRLNEQEKAIARADKIADVPNPAPAKKPEAVGRNRSGENAPAAPATPAAVVAINRENNTDKTSGNTQKKTGGKNVATSDERTAQKAKPATPVTPAENYEYTPEPEDQTPQDRFAKLLEDAIAPAAAEVAEYALLCGFLLFGGLSVAAVTGYYVALTTSIYYPMGVLSSAALMKYAAKFLPDKE